TNAGVPTADQFPPKRDWLIALMDLLKVRSRPFEDILRRAAPYLAAHVSYDPEAVAKQWKDRPATVDLLSSVRNTLAAVEPWEPPVMEEALRTQAERRGVGAGKLFQPLR